ncbi:MAG: hypothetical protein KME47_13955 [Nodosilinea sp. WJT8-NPBG4]|nr:hypothetical protein [Nodosilinea sp. WJT8-NPBG4]
MTTREQLLIEINSAPDFLLEEVLDFLLFAKTRRQQSPNLSGSDGAADEPPKPIWAAFEEFADSLPETTAATLPTDGAAQLDHYLYGFPKSDQSEH